LGGNSDACAALETSEAARELAASRSAAIPNLEEDLLAANADWDDLRRQNTHLRAMAGPEAVPEERPEAMAAVTSSDHPIRSRSNNLGRSRVG